MPSGSAERANEQSSNGMPGNSQPSRRAGGRPLPASLDNHAAANTIQESNEVPLPGGSFTALLNNRDLNDPAFDYATADLGQTSSAEQGFGAVHAPIVAPSSAAPVGAPASNSGEVAIHETSSRETIPVLASGRYPGMGVITPTNITESPNYFPAQTDAHHFICINRYGSLVCSCGRARDKIHVDFARHLGDMARRPWPCPVNGCTSRPQQAGAYRGTPGGMQKLATGGQLYTHVTHSTDGEHRAYCAQFARGLGEQVRIDSKNLARALGII